MILSDEKISHIVHLIFEGLRKAEMVEFLNEAEALKEAKKISLKYVSMLSQVHELSLQRIRSMKNAPPERSSQWETLYHKFYEEEMHKKGG